jgi:hypothetical protein
MGRTRHPAASKWPPGATRAAAWVCIVSAVVLAFTTCIASAQQAARETDVKAALLFNFSQFIEWPDSVPAPNQPFVIAILGDDPFGKTLDELVVDERAHGRPIEIRRYRRVEDVNAQILFISASEVARLGEILASLKGKPVLTVSDIPGTAFVRARGMIDLASEHNKIRLRINPEAARSSGLIVSAKLLQLAEIVGGDTNK